jgi:Protein of unknown function (DUF3800)
VISISEVAGRWNPAKLGKRYMAMLWFYCDESFDSTQKDPNTFVVAGLIAEESAWKKLEGPWQAKNASMGIKRFHSASINAFGGEFECWNKTERDEYVKDMFRIVESNGGLLAISCAIHADEYRRIINESGRESLGSPYIACFKICLLMIAKILLDIDNDLIFSVILERNESQTEAVDVFFRLKDDENLNVGRCMGTCAPGSWEEFIALQPADMIAYETYRQVHLREGTGTKRFPLKRLYANIPMHGVYFDAETLTLIKDQAEAATCSPNGFFPIFDDFDLNLSEVIDENES